MANAGATEPLSHGATDVGTSADANINLVGSWADATTSLGSSAYEATALVGCGTFHAFEVTGGAGVKFVGGDQEFQVHEGCVATPFPLHFLPATAHPKSSSLTGGAGICS